MDERNMTCPVCGHARAGEGLRCPNCQFPQAFVTCFAGERSHGFWERKVRAARRAWSDRRLPLLSAPGAFTLDWKEASFLDTERHVLTRFRAGGEPVRMEQVRQYSPGSHHAVLLHTDGTVEARGDNDYGQCTVKDLKDIVFVAAGPQCTLAVEKNGRVHVRGACACRTQVEGWEEIQAVACGSYHVVGLRRDGQVRFAGGPLAPAVFRSAPPVMTVPVISVEAATDCALFLHKNGTVTFAGRAGDPRSGAGKWEDIQAVAADGQYAVGLTRDGRVLLAGERHTLLSAGRVQAEKWIDLAAIACGGSCIGGITRSGELRLAGDMPNAAALQAAWEPV